MRAIWMTLAILVGCAGDGDKGDTDSAGGTLGDDDDDNGGVLTEEEFGDAFVDRYCLEYEACNTTGDACIFGTTTTTTTTGTCAFDPAAAQACLDGVWSCNVDFPGLEYVVPPAACATVCG